MCSLGYNSDNIKKVSGDNSTCPKSFENVPAKDLNYPSMVAAVQSNKPFTVTFHRTVKNVGFANSTYKAEVFPDSELKVKVVPDVLSFKALEEKKSFNVTVSGGALGTLSRLSTTLTWSDGRHIVFEVIRKQDWYKPDVYLYKDLIFALARCRKMDEAVNLWESFEKGKICSLILRAVSEQNTNQQSLFHLQVY